MLTLVGLFGAVGELYFKASDIWPTLLKGLRNGF